MRVTTTQNIRLCHTLVTVNANLKCHEKYSTIRKSAHGLQNLRRTHRWPWKPWRKYSISFVNTCVDKIYTIFSSRFLSRQNCLKLDKTVKFCSRIFTILLFKRLLAEYGKRKHIYSSPYYHSIYDINQSSISLKQSKTRGNSIHHERHKWYNISYMTHNNKLDTLYSLMDPPTELIPISWINS